MFWSKFLIKKRLHILSARPLTQRLNGYRSAESLSSVTKQLKSRSEQCSSAKKKTEQSDSSFDPSVYDLLESSEDEDQTDESTEDLSISTSIFNEDECLGPKVSDAFAKRINEAFFKKPIESKFKALAEKYCSPENCNLLTVARVNPGIWIDFPRASRKLDFGQICSPRSSGNYISR